MFRSSTLEVTDFDGIGYEYTWVMSIRVTWGHHEVVRFNILQSV